MEDIRLAELRYIIQSFNNSGDLTDIAVKNIFEFLDYTEMRFNKVVSDHKAAVKIMKDKIKELENTKVGVDCTCSLKQAVIDEQIKLIENLKCCENCTYDEWDYDIPLCPFYSDCVYGCGDNSHWEMKIKEESEGSADG